MWITALLVCGLVTGLVCAPVLRALPEPADGPAAGKPPYATLASLRCSLGVGACALAAGLVVAASLSAVSGLIWLPLATVGVLLVCIDALTTWLPLVLTRVLWLATLVAAAAQVLVTDLAQRPELALRMGVGAVGVGLFFWAFWWVVGGLGFGDVRLAPVLGATLAAVSWSAVAYGLLLGTLLGATTGLVRLVRGRSGPFPYGPALVAGAFAGLLLAG